VIGGRIPIALKNNLLRFHRAAGSPVNLREYQSGVTNDLSSVLVRPAVIQRFLEEASSSLDWLSSGKLDTSLSILTF